MKRAEEIAADPDFRPLSALPQVGVDLRYAGSNNFTGAGLYDGLDCAWLRSEAAAGLAAAAGWLAANRPGWRILVLDALRPQRVQERLWRSVVGTPAAAYFADPQRGSMHSFGMAVDATLVDPAGNEADMGSAYDEMAPISQPALHAEHLASGALSTSQVDERNWLRRALAHGGFTGIASEWWHFDHGDADRVRATLLRVW